MSILDHAPSFTPEEALQVAQSLFNLEITGTSLPGGCAEDLFFSGTIRMV
jgi:hypothetical protein